MTSKPLIIATQTNSRVSATSVWFLIFRCWQFLCVLIFVGGGLTQCLSASTPAALQLSAGAQVDSRGVFLGQLVKSDQPLPSLRLCDAPAFGKTTELTRAQVNDLLATAASGLVTTNWTGADTVEISRRTRTLSEMDALDLLTSTLQKSYAKDRGDLELNFTQPWDAPTVPDEPLTVKVLELPAEGIESAFIIRFELRTATETPGCGLCLQHLRLRLGFLHCVPGQLARFCPPPGQALWRWTFLCLMLYLMA